MLANCGNYNIESIAGGLGSIGFRGKGRPGRHQASTMDAWPGLAWRSRCCFDVGRGAAKGNVRTRGNSLPPWNTRRLIGRSRYYRASVFPTLQAASPARKSGGPPSWVIC